MGLKNICIFKVSWLLKTLHAPYLDSVVVGHHRHVFFCCCLGR